MGDMRILENATSDIENALVLQVGPQESVAERIDHQHAPLTQVHSAGAELREKLVRIRDHRP